MLTPNDEATNYDLAEFGTGVAISADGNTGSDRGSGRLERHHLRGRRVGVRSLRLDLDSAGGPPCGVRRGPVHRIRQLDRLVRQRNDGTDQRRRRQYHRSSLGVRPLANDLEPAGGAHKATPITRELRRSLPMATRQSSPGPPEPPEAWGQPGSLSAPARLGSSRAPG